MKHGLNTDKCLEHRRLALGEKQSLKKSVFDPCFIRGQKNLRGVQRNATFVLRAARPQLVPRMICLRHGRGDRASRIGGGGGGAAAKAVSAEGAAAAHSVRADLRFDVHRGNVPLRAAQLPAGFVWRR